jgi:hypothetical protein
MRRSKLLGILFALCLVAILVVAGAFVLGRHLFGGGGTSSFRTIAATCPTENAEADALDQVAPGAGGAAVASQSNLSNFGSLASGAAGSTATPAPAGQLTCRALAPDIEAAFAAVDKDASSIGRDWYDENARAGELADANAVFAFVRDQIHTEAYAGAMRGGLGALMSGGGSPDDKTLLLAQLLGVKGIAVRFVHANLSDAEVESIANAVLATPQSQPNPPTDAVRMYDDALGSATPFTNQITQTLAQAHVATASTDAALRSQWATNLRDHWWLQAQEGSDWIDLDPTLANAQPGSHMGAAPTDPPQDALPDALYPTLTFRIIGEYTGGSTQTLIQQTTKTADAYAQPISIAIQDPNAKLGTLNGSTSFVASISAGSGSATSDPLTPDPPSGSRLLRLRLETETDRPGYPALVQEQIIMNRADQSGANVDPSWTAQRTSVFLNGVRYYGLAVGGTINPQFILAREVEAAHELHALAIYAINAEQLPFPSGAEQSYPISVMRFFERDELLRALIDQEDGTQFFFNRPLVAFVHRVFDWDGTHLLARNDFDIVESGMDVDGHDAATAVTDNITRGVVEDADEENYSMSLGSGPILTTRAVFSAAGPTATVVAVAPSASPLPALSLAAAALTSSLSRGAVVTVSQPVRIGTTPHIGWWEVDPQSGSTIGRLESGAGQEETEYVSTQKIAFEAIDRANLVANFDMCLLSESVGALTGGSDVSGAAHGCMVEAVCKFELSQSYGAWAEWLFGEGAATGIPGGLSDLSGLSDGLCGK